MASDLVGDELTGETHDLTGDELRHVQLVVCGRADGVDDARLLLSALGLINPPKEGPEA